MDLYKYYSSCGGVVSTDTRSIAKGSLFFALKGTNFDGNRFALEAIEKGASYAVVDDAQLKDQPRCLYVPDVLEALQALARQHSRLLNIPIIAVGGSNGKTTTKELIAKVLSKKYQTFATRGNLNNHIGVPLSLLSIGVEIEIAVIEMGANGPNEIALLCEIAEPSHGVITNIGRDHLEGFGSIEGVAKANSELYYYLLNNDGVAFVNTQEEYLSRMASRFSEYVSYPAKGDYYTCQLHNADMFLQVQAANGDIIQTQIIGAYNFNNIATALCIGKYFGVPDEAAHAAVAEYVPSNNRSQLLRTTHNTVILDAYNANPSSMKVSVENFAQMRVNGQKVLVLGDMFELGNDSQAEHRALGELIGQYSFDMVCLCGEDMKAAQAVLPKAVYFPTRQSLESFLTVYPVQNAYVLLKGSRGMSLEKLVPLL